jgi:glycosyltransferase involved in cell wall biosynthesis
MSSLNVRKPERLANSTSATAPKVSVCILCYNHAKYIGECLDSIVQQVTNFPFEVIVGDDASTDGSREILHDYARRYPNTVRLLLHEKRVGGNANYCATHGDAHGQYVCHVDGDDLACPGKLQTQADFLDNHSECVIVGHNMKILLGQHIIGVFSDREIPVVTDVHYLIRNNCFFGSSSKMYRRELAFLEGMKDGQFVDFSIHLDQALHGNIGYIDQPLGVYRKHEASITKVSRQRILEAHIRGYQYARRKGVHEEVVREGLRRFLMSNTLTALVRADRNEFDFCMAILNQENLSGWKSAALVLLSRLSFPAACALGRAYLAIRMSMKRNPDSTALNAP